MDSLFGERDLVTIPCDLCGSADCDVLFVKEGFAHVRCRGCGLVFVNPRLRAHLDAQKISGTGCMGDEKVTTKQQRRYRKELRALESYRERNALLEIGPGRGWFLAAAAGEGWDVWAVEINEDALKYLAKNNIENTIAHSAETFHAPPESMDVVRMWDVIEHLQSPRRAVENCFRVLRPGGLLRIATTNFASLSRRVNGPEWVYLNGSDHIVLFEPRTMKHLLRQGGFTRIRIRTKSFNLRRKLYYPEQDLPAALPLLRPFRKIIDELIRFTPYGHQMIVEAVKPRNRSDSLTSH